MVLFSPGVAGAADDPATDPLTDLLDQVTSPLEDLLPPGALPGGSKHAPGNVQDSPKAPPTTQDDDSPGHETPNPSGPDHGSGQIADAELAETDVAELSHSDASIDEDDSTSSDATILALGGTEVLGAHADSDGNEKESFGDPLAPVCEASNGALCVALLYADAEATEGAHSSKSSSRSGIASACVGGSDGTGETCDGPLNIGAAQSSGSTSRGRDGETKVAASSQLADVCLQPDPLTGACLVGADASKSDGAADSRGSSERSSQVAALEIGGEEVPGLDQLTLLEDPTGIALPPECTTPSLLCVFLNQGESYRATGVAGAVQEALHVSALDGLLDVTAGNTSTLAHDTADDAPDPDDPNDSDDPGDTGDPGDSGNPGDGGNDGPSGGQEAGGVLPNTGGVWSGFMALGLFGVAAGSFLVAWSRRRELVRADAGS